MNANHRTMCQYPHKNSENYALIRAALQDLSSKAREKKRNENHDGESITRIVSHAAGRLNVIREMG